MNKWTTYMAFLRSKI